MKAEGKKSINLKINVFFYTRTLKGTNNLEKKLQNSASSTEIK